MMYFRYVVQRIGTVALMLWALALPVFAQSSQTGARLENPLRFPTIEAFIQGVLQATVMIALPIITLFIVYAGFRFIAARGRTGEQGLDGAKKNLVYVLVGAALILGAWVLATLIGGTVTQLLGGSTGSGVLR